MKQLLRRMIQVRVGIQWYLLALFVPLIPFFLIIILFNGFSVFLHVFSLRGVGGLLAYVIATFIGMVLGSPIGEEPGWRGFALPRLQQRYGALLGSLILGPLWGLWHLPLFFTVWGTAYQIIGVLLGLLLYVPITTSYTIFMTWLFNNTRGSIFLAILSHAAINSTLAFSLVVFPEEAQAALNPAKLGAATILGGLLAAFIIWAAIAALVIGLTKGRLSYKLPVSAASMDSSESDSSIW